MERLNPHAVAGSSFSRVLQASPDRLQVAETSICCNKSRQQNLFAVYEKHCNHVHRRKTYFVGAGT